MMTPSKALLTFGNGPSEFGESTPPVKMLKNERNFCLHVFRVIQEYLEPPLLLRGGRKFHIRAYLVAVGAIDVFLSTEMLALFADEPYHTNGGDLAGQITNTCSQDPCAREMSVFLLSELDELETARQSILDQVRGIAADVFDALAAEASVFQPLPNAFEM